MIPVNEPAVGQKEFEYVHECLKTGWISSAGKFIEKFEEKWASYCGRKYGVAMNNGTTALQAAVRCLDIEEGAEIIMPSFTIVSCAMAAVYNGLTPVLVDCEPDTWCIAVSQIEKKITKKTKAIMPVHIYGHPCDIAAIKKLAEKYNLFVIEDAAEAHGAQYQGRKCGSFGDISCFSFYANKIITTGEGGMALTDSEKYAGKLRELRNLCFIRGRRFLHYELGFNFRITNLQCAIGLAQVERIEELVEKKRRIGASYNERLKDVTGITLPVEKPGAKNVYWMYGIIIKEETGLDAEKAAKLLAAERIETRPFFLGMHEQPVFHKMGLFKGESYPVTERIAKQGLYLPSGLTLTGAQIEEVCSAVERIVK